MPRKNTSKPKKTAKAKAGKLNSLSQTHGKTDKKPTPTTLDQIWGDDGVWKYNTMAAEIYSRQLDEYNLTIRGETPKTLTFREDVKGWVSFKSFIPEHAVSCANDYYTFLNDHRNFLIFP